MASYQCSNEMSWNETTLFKDLKYNSFPCATSEERKPRLSEATSLAHGLYASKPGCKDLSPSLMAVKPCSSTVRVPQQNPVHKVLRIVYAQNVLLSPVLCIIPSSKEG